MSMKFIFDELDSISWNKYSSNIDQFPLFQSSMYLQSIVESSNSIVRYFLIQNEDKINIGLAGFQIKFFFKVFKIYQLNRGPVFFNNVFLDIDDLEKLVVDLFEFVSKNRKFFKIYFVSPELRANSRNKCL